eukprot:5131442-Lingulodinium_polyedra.AAC.1
MAASTAPPSSSTQPHTVYSAPSSAQDRSRAAMRRPKRTRLRLQQGPAEQPRQARPQCQARQASCTCSGRSHQQQQGA